MRTRRYCIEIVAILLIAASSVHAGTPRILMVGDSWAWFMWINRSFQGALERAGLEEFEERGNYTTVPGSTSKQWLNPQWLSNVTRELELHPTLDIVHLSLGGNGFLRGWRPDMSEEKRDALFQSVVDNITVVIEHCLAVRPNVRVAIVNYDYVNDTNGGSTIPELNQAGMILARMKQQLAQKYDRVEYIQNYGLMQYHFGAPPDLAPHAVPLPGQAPNFEPFPGGNVNYGGAPEAMLDKIHLSIRGYEILADHCIEVLYKKWLAAPLPAPAPMAQAESESAPAE